MNLYIRDQKFEVTGTDTVGVGVGEPVPVVIVQEGEAVMESVEQENGYQDDYSIETVDQLPPDLEPQKYSRLQQAVIDAPVGSWVKAGFGHLRAALNASQCVRNAKYLRKYLHANKLRLHVKVDAKNLAIYVQKYSVLE